MSEQTGSTPSTEDQILAGIEDAESGSQPAPYGSEPTQEQIDEVEGTSTGQPQPAPTTDESQQPAPDQQTTGEGDQAKQQQEGDGPKDLKSDQKGNLVDRETGEIVVNRGGERRLYERAVRENERLTEIAKQQAATIDQLNNQYAQQKALNLTPDQVDLGLRVVHQFQSDPVAAARFVVAEAMRAGHNLEAILGKDAAGTSTLDMGALNKMIDDKLRPVIDDRTQRQSEQARLEVEQQAERDYHAFLDAHEHASVHEDAIARLMGTQNIAPETAYWRVRTFATENGYDFSQPLEPQILARRSDAPAPAENGAAPAQHGAKPMARPIPQGSQATVQVVPNTTHENDAGMDPEADYDTIVQQAMREAGI